MSQNKLEEYMIESSTIYANKYIHPGVERVMKLNSYRAGFDAAIALDLPVKFAEWKDGNYTKLKDKFHPRKTGMQLGYFPANFDEAEGKTLDELYQYWIDNVYKPE